MGDYAKKIEDSVKSLNGIDKVTQGVSKREAVYQQNKVILFHYQATSKKVSKTPLLIVYAMVNRPYMLDLQENKSIIRRLLDEGQDVYLIDWGYADELDAETTLNDYINGYLNDCVDEIKRRTQVNKINVLGVCQGGCFSLCYSALYSEKVNKLITMVTPIDFQTDGNLLSAWVQHIDIDELVDTMGNISGDLLSSVFLSLKPFLLQKKKYIDAVDMLDDSAKLNNFLVMEKWIFDSPDQAGEAFRQFIKDFYQQNKLLKGGLVLGDKKVNLKKIKCPILNVYAEQDHLVPPEASRALKGLTNSKNYTELAFQGGHISLYVSSKPQALVASAMAKWLKDSLIKSIKFYELSSRSILGATCC